MSDRTTAPRGALWAIWGVCVALVVVVLAIPALLPSRPTPWYEAQTAVAGFVLTLLALVTGVGTFTLRESLALRDVRSGALDPSSAEGFARLRGMLLVLWFLCLVIALLGCGLGWGAASPRLAWPYGAAATGLLLWHAPRRALFELRAG